MPSNHLFNDCLLLLAKLRITEDGLKDFLRTSSHA